MGIAMVCFTISIIIIYFTIFSYCVSKSVHEWDISIEMLVFSFFILPTLIVLIGVGVIALIKS